MARAWDYSRALTWPCVDERYAQRFHCLRSDKAATLLVLPVTGLPAVGVYVLGHGFQEGGQEVWAWHLHTDREEGSK